MPGHLVKTDQHSFPFASKVTAYWNAYVPSTTGLSEYYTPISIYAGSCACLGICCIRSVPCRDDRLDLR